MTKGEYDKLRAYEMRGRRVRTLTELRNGHGVIPKGATATITDKHRGLALVMDACESCGVQMRISRVSYSDVELQPESGACEV